MAVGKQISELNNATTLSSEDLLAVSQVNKPEATKATVGDLAAAVGELNENGAMSELVLATSQGKNMLAQALTEKGIETSSSESLTAMANKVRTLVTTGSEALTSIVPEANTANGKTYSASFYIPRRDAVVVITAGVMYFIKNRGNFTNINEMLDSASFTALLTDFDLSPSTSYCVAFNPSRTRFALLSGTMCKLFKIAEDAFELVDTYTLGQSHSADIASADLSEDCEILIEQYSDFPESIRVHYLKKGVFTTVSSSSSYIGSGCFLISKLEENIYKLDAFMCYPSGSERITSYNGTITIDPLAETIVVTNFTMSYTPLPSRPYYYAMQNGSLFRFSEDIAIIVFLSDKKVNIVDLNKRNFTNPYTLDAYLNRLPLYYYQDYDMIDRQSDVWFVKSYDLENKKIIIDSPLYPNDITIDLTNGQVTTPQDISDHFLLSSSMILTNKVSNTVYLTDSNVYGKKKVAINNDKRFFVLTALGDAERPWKPLMYSASVVWYTYTLHQKEIIVGYKNALPNGDTVLNVIPYFVKSSLDAGYYDKVQQIEYLPEDSEDE